MSQEKRDQLIAEGKLNKDGSRIERCPTCGTELTAEQAELIRGSAHGEAELIEAGVESPAPNGEEA
jgi:hypothetical protein